MPAGPPAPRGVSGGRRRSTLESAQASFRRQGIWIGRIGASAERFLQDVTAGCDRLRPLRPPSELPRSARGCTWRTRMRAWAGGRGCPLAARSQQLRLRDRLPRLPARQRPRPARAGDPRESHVTLHPDLQQMVGLAAPDFDLERVGTPAGSPLRVRLHDGRGRVVVLVIWDAFSDGVAVVTTGPIPPIPPCIQVYLTLVGQFPPEDIDVVIVAFGAWGEEIDRVAAQRLESFVQENQIAVPVALGTSGRARALAPPRARSPIAELRRRGMPLRASPGPARSRVLS